MDGSTVATVPTQPAAADVDESDRQGMELLAAHIPLTLLLDLVGRGGPGSKDILVDEKPSPDELSWLAAAADGGSARR